MARAMAAIAATVEGGTTNWMGNMMIHHGILGCPALFLILGKPWTTQIIPDPLGKRPGDTISPLKEECLIQLSDCA